jgi:phospholipase C
MSFIRCLVPALVGVGSLTSFAAAAGIADIDTVVVIYAENRSFDNVFGHFANARGVNDLKPEDYLQVDRDGAVLRELPPIWSGLTANGVTPAVAEGQTKGLSNAPFAIDDPKGLNTPVTVATRDLVHGFYQQQMQINGGRNDRFVAYGDSGALVMGNYAQAANLKLWDLAKKYTLADNFFHASFGGSFLNHFALVCACAPRYPNADADGSPIKGKGKIAEVDEDGVSLKLAPNSPSSAMDGSPKYVTEKATLTPDFYAVNTMQPPYQPSAVPPVAGEDPALADKNHAAVLPPQHEVTIGDLLSVKGIDWAWYAGAWQMALDGKNAKPTPNFQFHHQPFNYFAQYAPGTSARAAHLRDGGLNGAAFIADIDAGKLPAVTFYKPQGNLNEHPDYSAMSGGDDHIADLVDHFERSPQWAHMLVIVTFDENGGFWDHVAPPKADRWGPGSRIPTLIISPLAKKDFVDHTQYDSTSILRLVTRRWSLPVLPGLIERDQALAVHHEPPMGDLTGAIEP